MLTGAHEAGKRCSTATRGREREDFVETFLKAVFPPSFRFGSGDVTDRRGNRSGQVDVVIEYPLLPSLPIASDSERLYLAEGVAAALEIKSDVAKQWGEVLGTAKKLSTIRRRFETSVSFGTASPSARIPLFAVGYQGWQKSEAIKAHIAESDLDGVLVIDPGIFVCKPGFGFLNDVSGPIALWALISSLHSALAALSFTTANPGWYLLTKDAQDFVQKTAASYRSQRRKGQN